MLDEFEIPLSEFLNTYMIRHDDKWFYINGAFITNEYGTDKKGKLVLSRRFIDCTMQDELGYEFLQCKGVIESDIIKFSITDRTFFSLGVIGG